MTDNEKITILITEIPKTLIINIIIIITIIVKTITITIIIKFSYLSFI